MQDLFITKIHINKVRHLDNIDICLSESEKKHLILTGKNGSGKTSIMEALSKAYSPLSIGFMGQSHLAVAWGGYIDEVRVFHNKRTEETPIEEVEEVLAYIPANRTLNIELPKSIEPVDLSIQTNCNESASKDFVKYLLHLNYQKMYATVNNNRAETVRITKWFDNFVSALREIYDCPELELQHNSKDLSYNIILPDREPFGLNEMADGYSSFLNIAIELMMRMENKASMTYDLPGIVLIDEIETHLHVELQKQVFPFLTKMFPRIQFIVTTHSPFVITSVSNAVVYDLEKHISITDMSAYSYEAVIEHYYDISMYSVEADKQFEIYKSLVNKENRSSDEMEQLIDAITYLKQIPLGAAEELVYSFREMEAQRRQRANG